VSEPLAAVRLDRWLWAARFYKTRPLAVAAIDGGKVQVNGDRVKRSKLIKPGDQVRIRQDPYEYLIEVTELADKRGSAKVAATLYQESAESLAAQRRDIRKWKRGDNG
jgi:ribosome-associated heat shock protein Hsp15